MPYDPEQLAVDVDYLTTLPQWQDEAKRPEFIRQVALQAGPNLDPQAHGEFANALWERSKGNVLQRGAEFVARGGEEVLKSIPASGGAAVFAASDALGITDTGSGTRLKRGVADLVDATGQRLKQLGGGEILGMNLLPGQSKQAVRDQTLDALKQSLDQGLYPQGLEQWMTGAFDDGTEPPDDETKQWIDLMTRGIAERAVAADHMGKVKPEKVREWLQSDRNPAFADSDIPGEPGPRELLADYLATRDPSSWEAFQARVSETDSQRTTRLRRFAAEGQMRATTATMPEGLGKDLAVRSMDMQTSPIDLASAALPIFRGRAALQAARSGGAGAQMLRGMGAEGLQEGATEYLSDPNASPERVLEAAGLGAVGQGVVSAPMAGAGALLRRRDNLSTNDPAPPPNETPAPTQPPAPGQPGAAAPMGAGAPGAAAVSPLIGIAQRGGAVDVTLPEDTGELTAEEVADLEMTNEEGRMTNAVRQPILQGVPDQVPSSRSQVPSPQQAAPFRESSINEEPIMEGDAITDLRIPRSPEAIAESQRIEAERQQQIATMRMLDARAQGMPLIPDSPSGSRDILDFANENPIYLPPGFSEERNLPEYEKLKEAKLPPYWRQFVASSKRGGNPSDVAQRAFDAGFIDAPTADAYLEAVRGGIEGRQQYRVQFAQRDKALQQEEERVVNFEQSQNKLARKRSTERVDFEDIRVGDAMTIDGEPAVVRNIEYDQDGYLTNVVIEDGKRFGLMQFDPQTRGGILVDEFQPRAQRSANTPESAQPESDPTPGFQHLVIDRDLEAGFMSGAGADALIDLAHRAFAAGRTFAQWAAAMVQRFGAAVRDYLAGVWDHAKRSSQTGALNFTSRLGEQLQQASQQAARPTPAAATAAPLKAAYASALRGSSTAMIPLADVFAAAQAANPALTQEQFQAQVMADYESGSLMLEGAGSPQEAQNAGLRIDGTPVGSAVRMMVPQGFTHLDVSGRASQRGAVQIDSGTVREGPNETQSRFASPNPADRTINGPRTDELVTAEANAWLGSMDQQAAIEAFVAGQVPLSLDTAERAAATLIANLSEQAATAKTEMARMWAHVQGRRMARVWTTEHLSADPARALRQRGVVNNTILAPIAPVLAAQELLEDRAQKVIDQRFNGGTEGAVEKVKDIATTAGEQAGTDLAADLEGETTPGAPTRPGQPPRPRKLGAKHPNLKKMLDALRKKMFPGMTWADIFTQLPETQKARQREIYRRLMLDERLRNLTPEERLALTNELDKAWQRERRKVFMRELEKAGVLGEAKPKDREKVKAAAPRLLRLMNLGMLNSEMFREALAKEYGLNVIDAATAAELRAIGERIQKAPEGLPRRKLEQQLVERLQKLSGYTLFQVLDSWWTASVLSGWRTQVDIGLSIANGIEDIGLGSIVAALRTGNKDVAIRGLSALFGRIPSAFREAVNHVATGNKAMMRNFELEVKQAMEGGNQLASDVGRQMWDRGGWRKVPGGFMVFYGRLMTALDHVNSASTREGAKALALARHPDLYQKALRISDADRAAARQQARLELTGGAVPATQQERIEENARVREILEQGIPAEVLAEATEVGRAAALQGEPTGLGGALLDAVLSAVSVVNRKAQELANRPNPDRLTRQGAAITAAMVPMARAITGTKFARTVAHSINRTASYVPGLGAYAVGQQGRTGAFGDILAAKQVIGTLVGIALYLAFDDDDDEKGIEDSWKDKTPQQKAQLYAQGKQPFTIWTRDEQGRVRNWNYQQWGIAGIVNTVAAMLKQKGSEAGTLNVLMSSITQGAMSFTDKAQLQGLQTVFGENFRSTDPASGIAASLNKWAAQTVGGVVPRLYKDIEMVYNPELHQMNEWWQKWAKEVPMGRKLSSGKRIDILGQDITLDRGPLSRVTQLGTADPIYRTLGRLNERDVWLPDPSQGVRVVKFSNGTRRNMNPQEKDRYQRLTGAAYRAYLEKEGAALLQMSPEDAQEAVSKATARLRSTAAYQATH